MKKNKGAIRQNTGAQHSQCRPLAASAESSPHRGGTGIGGQSGGGGGVWVGRGWVSNSVVRLNPMPVR